MEYSRLVEVYEELSKTTKRLEKTHILSEFLKDLSSEDMEHAILLLEGRVFPNYDPREIGIAARTMLKSLSAATGISIDAGAGNYVWNARCVNSIDSTKFAWAPLNWSFTRT